MSLKFATCQRVFTDPSYQIMLLMRMVVDCLDWSWELLMMKVLLLMRWLLCLPRACAAVLQDPPPDLP